MARRYKVKGKRAYVVRNKKGQFKNWHNRSKSAKADRRKQAKKVKSGYGYKGDLKPKTRKRKVGQNTLFDFNKYA